MDVIITLTNPGADTGPFNIYTNDDNYTATVATNVAKSALLAGYNVWVPPLAVTVKVESTGACGSCIFIPIAQPTTTTTSTSSTTTSTTTEPPETTTTTTTYFGPSTTTSTTTILRYPVRIAAVTDNLTCATGTAESDWWSFTSIGTGYYTINGGTTKYYIETLGDGSYDPLKQIVSTVATTCTPTAYYYYLAEEYYCDTCSIVDPQNPTKLVKAVVSTLVPDKFYTSFDVSNYVYKITSVGEGPGAAYQINTQQYGSCAAMGCGTVTTTLPLPILNRIDDVRYSLAGVSQACAADLGYVFSYNTTFDNSDKFYSDINGINLAPDGYYSALSGVTQRPKVREQSQGVLLSSVPCE